MHEDIVPLLSNIFRFSDGSTQVVLVTATEEDAGKSHVAHALCELAIARGIPSVLLQLDDSSERAGAPAGVMMPQYVVRTDVPAIERFLSDAGNDSLGLGNIQDDFGLIVIDAPPLTSDRVIADLASDCDLTVLVASWEKTTIAAVRAAQGILAAGGEASAVAVINGIDAERYALFDPEAAEGLVRQAA
jgi:Mrp family chromosome partitioning ATPase